MTGRTTHLFYVYSNWSISAGLLIPFPIQGKRCYIVLIKIYIFLKMYEAKRPKKVTLKQVNLYMHYSLCWHLCHVIVLGTFWPKM